MHPESTASLSMAFYISAMHSYAAKKREFILANEAIYINF